MRAESFGTYTFPQYRGSHQLDTAPAVTGIVQTAGGQAVDAYGTDDSPPASGTFGVSFYLIATTQALLDAQLDTVRALGRKSGVLWAVMGDGSRRWITARCTGVRVTRTAELGAYQPVELSFEAAYPIWQGEDEIGGVTGFYDVDMLPMTGVADWNPEIASGVAQTIYHDGTVTQYDVLWEFLASGAAFTSSIQVDNTTTGYQFTWTGTVADGNTLRVDCWAETVYNEATPAYTGFTRPVDKERWFALAPGLNSITITYTGGGSAHQIAPKFYPAFA